MSAIYTMSLNLSVVHENSRTCRHFSTDIPIRLCKFIRKMSKNVDLWKEHPVEYLMILIIIIN